MADLMQTLFDGCLCFTSPCTCGGQNVDPGGTDPDINPMGGLFECRPDSFICLGSRGVRFPRFETRTTVTTPVPGIGTLAGRTLGGLLEGVGAAVTTPLVLIVIGLVLVLLILKRAGS